MIAMVDNLHRRRVVRFAGAMLASALALVATVALAQTSGDTTEQVLGNRRPLPLPTEPYQRSRADQLYRERLRNQALQSQSQTAREQQRLIDQSGRQLRQNLQAQRQSDLLF